MNLFMLADIVQGLETDVAELESRFEARFKELNIARTDLKTMLAAAGDEV